jgi:hypothetical protein
LDLIDPAANPPLEFTRPPYHGFALFVLRYVPAAVATGCIHYAPALFPMERVVRWSISGVVTAMFRANWQTWPSKATTKASSN